METNTSMCSLNAPLASQFLSPTCSLIRRYVCVWVRVVLCILQEYSIHSGLKEYVLGPVSGIIITELWKRWCMFVSEWRSLQRLFIFSKTQARDLLSSLFSSQIKLFSGLKQVSGISHDSLCFEYDPRWLAPRFLLIIRHSHHLTGL